MFVRYFVELEAPCSVTEAALTSDATAWLPGLATLAGAGGERRLAEVGFGKAIRLDRKVLVEVGTSVRLESKTLLPVAWRPASHEALLPAMEGEIEIAPVGAAQTQLSMTARYTPPYGFLGHVADRALLHRVAEATVKDFVDRVAAQLKELLSARPDGASPALAADGRNV